MKFVNRMTLSGAAGHNHVENVKCLLRFKEVDVNWANWTGATPLLAACENDRTESARVKFFSALPLPLSPSTLSQSLRGTKLIFLVEFFFKILERMISRGSNLLLSLPSSFLLLPPPNCSNCKEHPFRLAGAMPTKGDQCIAGR